MKRILLVLSLTLGACATTTTQMEACPEGGCGPASPKTTTNTESKPTATLVRQAAFDLKCDGAQLVWTALGEESATTDVRSWGVRGCGRQATYALEPRCGNNAGPDCTWILNSPVQSAPAS